MDEVLARGHVRFDRMSRWDHGKGWMECVTNVLRWDGRDYVPAEKSLVRSHVRVAADHQERLYLTELRNLDDKIEPELVVQPLIAAVDDCIYWGATDDAQRLIRTYGEDWLRPNMISGGRGRYYEAALRELMDRWHRGLVCADRPARPHSE